MIFQDEVISASLKLPSYINVLHLDLLSFQSVHDSLCRLEAAEKNEQAWTSMIAAQGQSKAMKDWTKPWVKRSQGEAATKGESEFLAKFGSGW